MLQITILTYKVPTKLLEKKLITMTYNIGIIEWE
jgi:hypothetical protein